MSLWTDLWNLFFPSCCLICGRTLLEGEEHVCFHCLSELPRTQMHWQRDNEVEKCFWGKIPVERASAFLYYSRGGDVKELLAALKYRGRSSLGHFLGRCMATELLFSGFYQGIDCIVPVPLHPRKQKRRGYNQSEVLAEGISAITGIPVFPHLLYRNQDTHTQTHKGGRERWASVGNVFGCKEPGLLEDKHVLLVDDVLTTGATMVACADALGQVPGLRISVLTLALSGDY